MEGDKVFLVGEVSVSALDAPSGKLLWKRGYPEGLMAYPVLMGDKLLLLFGEGGTATLLGCDGATGDASWS